MTSFKFTVRTLGMISGLCLAMLTPSTGSAILIDSFNFGAPPYGFGIPQVAPATSTVLANPDALGGQRTLSAASGGVGAVQLFGGTFSLINGDAVAGDATVLYNGGGSLGGLNFTTGGATSFNFFVVGQTAASVVNAFVTITNGSGTSATTPIALTGVGAYSIMFSSFSGPASITSVNTISFTLDGVTLGSDVSVDFLTSGVPVPEPSSLALALTGLGMAGVYFRRRQKQLTA